MTNTTAQIQACHAAVQDACAAVAAFEASDPRRAFAVALLNAALTEEDEALLRLADEVKAQPHFTLGAASRMASEGADVAALQADARHAVMRARLVKAGFTAASAVAAANHFFGPVSA